MARRKRKGIVSVLLDAFQQETMKPSGLTRGGIGDPLATQRFVRGRSLSTEECNAIYEENWLAGTIVDTLAEDMTQAGWRFVCKDNPDLEKAIQNEYGNLSLKANIYEAIRLSLIEGDGYIGIGLKETRQPILSEPPIKVLGIDYLHPFRRSLVVKQERETNPLEKGYGDWRTYYIVTGNAGSEPVPVHASRILHFRFFDNAATDWGNSIYRRLYEVIQVADNALWSIGQIVYQMVFKVLKVDFETFQKIAAEKGVTPVQLMERWAYDLNALTMFVIDKGDKDIPPDEIQFPALGGGLAAIPAARDFILMVLSAATRIPQSRLIGNEQGKLSGAEWDAQSYYARIRALQETKVQPQIEKITDYLLMGMGLDPAEIDYSIEFEPLYVETAATQAATAKVQAEIDAIYIDRQVLTPDEVRQKRFAQSPLLGELSGPGTPEWPEEEDAV